MHINNIYFSSYFRYPDTISVFLFSSTWSNSYAFTHENIKQNRENKTGPRGFEPLTYWLRAGRSTCLSYGPSEGYPFQSINISRGVMEYFMELARTRSPSFPAKLVAHSFSTFPLPRMAATSGLMISFGIS